MFCDLVGSTALSTGTPVKEVVGSGPFRFLKFCLTIVVVGKLAWTLR
jgi:hypothetical protein